jgi:hypothetical protein
LDWSQVNIEEGDGRGRMINKDFSVKITDEELAKLREIAGEIRYEKVFQWCLPRFGDDDDKTLFEFQLARM